MALSPFMAQKCSQFDAYYARATSVDTAGLPVFGVPVRFKGYHEGGIAMSKQTEGGRKLVDMDYFIIDAVQGCYAPLRDDRIWPPGLSQLDEASSQKVAKVIPIPDFNGTVSHYEVYL